MKTKSLEERIKEKYPRPNQSLIENWCSIGYKEGATEQREIDIQRACEWLLLNANNTTASWEDGVKEEKLVEEFKKYMLSENEL